MNDKPEIVLEPSFSQRKVCTIYYMEDGSLEVVHHQQSAAAILLLPPPKEPAE